MELWYTEEHTENARFSIKVDKHLFSEQSDFQRVDVFESYEFGKMLTLDGLMMVNEKDEFVYHDMIVHVPLASNPNIKNVLVIGGGDGGTVRELVRYNRIEHIDMVEIDKMVVDVSLKYLPITSSALSDKRVDLHYKDGIEFIKTKENEYDLILVDSTDPIGPGEGLFTTEFYNNCYKALTEDGILVNQSESPYYDRDIREFKRSYKKIHSTFPVSKIYQFHMPTYPSGHWLFGFASKGIDPVENEKINEWNKLGLKTKYYNTDIHRGAFMLPNFVKDMMNENE
ncbi:polyamine aminopropyltransferase [Helicovermis profundi]|uniref:Polyamine aminopropyltransferase n=1 Tax=Helicovermis profundi TaxID=3065157 RepID=A0AAU9E689_9FIRM|nr:polyamine aminopropyltransferase [Clostridia bacterium S502]